jgi:hypothetical protein
MLPAKRTDIIMGRNDYWTTGKEKEFIKTSSPLLNNSQVFQISV